MPETGYGVFSKCFHLLALGNRFIAETSFDIEQATLNSDIFEIIDERHVFIAGLARAGTTLLMRRFYASGQFYSLTYEDMPFVLMPNLWRKISSLAPRQSEQKERAHGDGLLIDYDSPEALEEVFWRIFSGDQYIETTKLSPMTANQELIRKFQLFVSAVGAAHGRKENTRYLSKNNNNILRLPAITTAFPNSLIIIPYRDPLEQAYSLLRLHLKFVVDHQQDPFFEKYMTWLAHHEFGADHRPFRFGNDLNRYKNTDEIEYWLELWINTYTWLYEGAQGREVFLSYESLCNDLDNTWNNLCQLACMPIQTHETDTVALQQHRPDPPDDLNLLSRANALYSKLKRRSI